MFRLSSFTNLVNLTGWRDKYHAFIDSLYRSKVLFVHVPKSGGTSLSHSLRATYPLSFFKLDEEPSRAACQELTDQQWMNFKRRTMIYYADSGRHYLQGHFQVTASILKKRFADYHAITLLRDPVDRVVSHYHFDPRLNRMTPEQFLDSKRGQVETHVLGHFFGGLDFDNPSNHDEAAMRAIETLEQFSVVGILEEIEHFQSLLYEKTGVKIKLPRRNVGGHRQSHPESFSEASMQRLREMTSLDQKVYDHFRDRYHAGTGGVNTGELAGQHCTAEFDLVAK